MILATLTGVAGAANEAVPGDLLYDLDRELEVIQLMLPQRDRSVQAVNERIAEERLQEASQLIESGEIVDALSLVEENQQTNNLIATNIVAQQTPSPVDSNELALDREAYCASGTSEEHPTLAAIATTQGISYPTVLNWYCSGYAVEDIEQAYSLSAASSLPVEILFTQFDSGIGWDEIAQAVGIVDTSDIEDTEAIDAFCAADGSQLPGTEHPEVAKIAEAEGESYETILAWFCDGNGIGEIRLAYTLSEYSGFLVEDIFELHDAGMSWGELTQEITKTPKPTATPKVKPTKEIPTPKPTKTEKPPKP
jgi:hypothetical protein